MNKSRSGFTIVELLIVIVVIAILAAISIVAYNGIQDRARSSQSKNDLALLKKAVLAARINTSNSFMQIAGSGHSGGSCFTAENTYPGSLPKTHSCWTRYVLTIDRLATAAEMNLDGLKNGDAYGAPYYIDENEGEDYGTYPGACRLDVVGVYINPLPASRNGYGLANHIGATGGYNWLKEYLTVAPSSGTC